MIPEDTVARYALRVRQGGGARYDAETAPHDDLLQARRGTAYFARKLNELSDVDLSGPSHLPGWTRAHIVSQTSYHARTLAHLLEAARTGGAQPAPPGSEARASEIALGATLPPRALRSLFRHAEVHLNVEWRDLADQDWNAALHLPDGRVIAARETPMLRASKVWRAAIDLNNGGRVKDIPETVQFACLGSPNREHPPIPADGEQ
ncbi:maleylpyruvate isomerase N-terminal domain-containing protein [Sulfitobacter sp. 1A16808]|uniref:maleylpyruvate isomerase N-terminal domain-containing protein n=1 Tax=Sulfitobacter sp. 1A16808 TaxID=3368572 RepID=UPI003745BADD